MAIRCARIPLFHPVPISRCAAELTRRAYTQTHNPGRETDAQTTHDVNAKRTDARAKRNAVHTNRCDENEWKPELLTEPDRQPHATRLSMPLGFTRWLSLYNNSTNLQDPAHLSPGVCTAGEDMADGLDGYYLGSCSDDGTVHMYAPLHRRRVQSAPMGY